MARPTPVDVQSGLNGWDARVNDNFTKTFGQPFPIHEHVGDETDLEATFPAASFENCLVWVDHSLTGFGLYRSDGAVWSLFSSGSGGGGISPNTPITLACSDETTVIVAGTAVTTFRMPGPFTLTKVRASLTDASSSGVVEVDVKVNGVSVFTTTLTIDANELTSETAATPAVLSTDPFEIDDDDEITVDIVQDGTGAVGLKVSLEGAMDPEEVAGEPHYSLAETAMLQKWVGGETIYRKVVFIASLPNTTAASTAHGITGLDTVIDLKGFATNGTTQRPIPNYHSSTNGIEVSVDATNINIATLANFSAYSAYVTIYYTK